MIVVDRKGNKLLDIIDVNEADADKEYGPINHCLAVVKIGDDYLMGWNNWRKDWEIFGGCREENETLRECITRECKEELGICVEFFYIIVSIKSFGNTCLVGNHNEDETRITKHF